MFPNFSLYRKKEKKMKIYLFLGIHPHPFHIYIKYIYELIAFNTSGCSQILLMRKHTHIQTPENNLRKHLTQLITSTNMT